MKKNSLHVAIVLDESGSMEVVQNSVVSNFNELIQNLDHENTTITLVKFNIEIKFLIKFEKISKDLKLSLDNYKPNRGTALLDAIGFTIDSLGEMLSSMNESDRPENILFVIITDGEENQSINFVKADIKDKITHQKEIYNWQFMFIGADIDAFAEARDLGIDESLNVDRTHEGMTKVCYSIARKAKFYRKNKE